MPLKTRELNEMTLASLTSQYRMPSTFLALSKAVISENEPFLVRDTHQLNKFIDQTSTTIGLKGMITPTLIRRSLDFIAHQEGYLKDKLPLR